jgi:ubiquinone/menaquinone biosynthesis C-methylase UbiE
MPTLYGPDFAEVYSRYGYNQFSARVAELLPQVLRALRVRPNRILDIPCGEGTFAIAMAKKGYRTTGVDRSSAMLRVARRKTRGAHANVRFVECDMRALRFHDEFDLVTSWYDSLNYLLRLDDLNKTFAGVIRALRPGGSFLFDMNTAQTLSKGWQRHPSFVEVDNRDAFALHRSTWDARRKVATLKVTCFVLRGRHWTRVDELHRERAYSLPQIRASLRRAGFTDVASWGSIRQMTPPRRGDRKYWFAARRPDE